MVKKGWKLTERINMSKQIVMVFFFFLVIGACEFITFASLIEKYVTFCKIIIDLVYNTSTNIRLNRWGRGICILLLTEVRFYKKSSHYGIVMMYFMLHSEKRMEIDRRINLSKLIVMLFWSLVLVNLLLLHL